jgi:hypothetical protein
VKRKWLLMTEEALSGEEITTAEVSEVRRKCTMQHVLTAVLRPRCLSGLIPTDQFIAEIVFLTTGNPEKTAINSELIRKISHFDNYVRFACLNRSNGLLLFIKLIYI